jgi:ABC-type Mn2+/Zn2+ transport system ATPase subunit
MAIPQSAKPHRAPILSATDLSVHYEERSALRDITLQISPGQTISLLGPNGAGKSTLLKVFAGMIPPSHGSVEFDGEPITSANECITYVPQRSGADWTFPISVLEATLLGRARSRTRWRPFSRDDRDRAMHALRQVRMEHLAKAQIGALSGGQQQRVFLARALLSCGRVLLLDEPFTGVDIPTQEMLVELFERLTNDGTAVIYATHDLQQAASTSDRVILLNEHIVAQGSPREVMTEPILRKTFGGQVIVVHASEPHEINVPDNHEAMIR